MRDNPDMSSLVPGTETGAEARSRQARLFDVSGLDLTATLHGREEIQRVIPHRYEMSLLDKIVWADPGYTHAIASLRVTGDEFWVRGHFPKRPMFPGVLMVEAGAQLACWMWQMRQNEPRLAAFLRIENAVFRRSVGVGDEMIILCKEIKASTKRFATDLQGLVDGHVCFEAQICGMNIGPA